jgi:hypothetical protein
MLVEKNNTYVDHSHHTKTKSAAFFFEDMQREFEVDGFRGTNGISFYIFSRLKSKLATRSYQLLKYQNTRSRLGLVPPRKIEMDLSEWLNDVKNSSRRRP